MSRGLCRPGAALPRAGDRGHDWSFAALAGLVVEVSAEPASGAALTPTVALVADAQREGETTAWIASTEGTFFPPDAVAAGVDLEALVVVKAPGAQAGARAADKLLRSAGFGLVVLDLGDAGAAARGLTPALQGRLHGLADRHRAVLACLTDKKADAPSLGAAVAVRVAAARRHHAGRWRVTLTALKDRRGRAGWRWEEDAHAPPGLR